MPTISATDLRHVLNNDVIGLRAANHHPYRLVFLDGCQTAKGTLCEKFGIPAQTLNNAFFISGTGVRSRAYVGYTKTIAFSPEYWSQRSLMLGWFFSDWINDLPLDICISNAVNDVHKAGAEMPSSVIVLGAPDLTIRTP